MLKITRNLLLPVLLVSILFLLFIPGCDEQEAAPGEAEVSQPELQQILADSMLAQQGVDSYQMKMDMDTTMNISGGPEEGTADMHMAMEGAIDQANMEMQMTMNISMDVDASDMGSDSSDFAEAPEISMEMYVLADSLYMKMDIPEMGEQWMKMPASEEMMEMNNINMAEQQLALLDSAGEMTFLGYESFGGSECYVIHLVPDTEKMWDWLKQQQMTGTESAWEDLDTLSDIFKELSYTCWIAKDTKYMEKITGSMLMEMSADDFGETGDDSGTMTLDIDFDMTMYDYNKPVSIVLPAEAENAMELPQFGGVTEE